MIIITAIVPYEILHLLSNMRSAWCWIIIITIWRNKVFLPGLSTLGSCAFCFVAAWILPSDAIEFSDSIKRDNIIEQKKKLFLRFEGQCILFERLHSHMMAIPRQKDNSIIFHIMTNVIFVSSIPLQFI